MAQSPRLHLIAPDTHPDRITTCVEAACDAGDVASILLPPNMPAFLTQRLQRLDLAVLIASDSQFVLSVRADGVEITDSDAYREARHLLGADRVVGANCGASRHLAMELAEAGADYIAFAQTGREDLISWWSEIFEIPCIAADPVSPGDLDILLPHRPDFIRPDDAMWVSPEAAHNVVAGLMARLKA
jgi:thiamine-phosphate pyrophosphorylase